MDVLIRFVVAWAPLLIFVGLFVWYMSGKHRQYMAIGHEAVEATRENTEALRGLAAKLDLLAQNPPERG